MLTQLDNYFEKTTGFLDRDYDWPGPGNFMTYEVGVTSIGAG